MRSTLTLLVLVMVGSMNSVSAQDAISDAELLQKLTQLEKASWDAAAAGDKKFFESYLAPEAVWFLADGTSVNRDSFLKDSDQLKVVKYNMGPTSLIRINEDAGLVIYRIAYEAVASGHKEIYSEIESSSLYVRRGGKWLEIFYQETPVKGASHGTAEEAKAMVVRAIELFKKEGVAAFDTITKGAGGFRDRDLYVFVAEANPEGKVVAYGGAKVPVDQLGRRLLDVQSPDGDPVGKSLLEIATSQGAWLDYNYIDPITDENEHKFSWVVLHDKYLFGCGIYVPTR